MKLDLKYRGHVATTEDVALIDKLMVDNPKDSRHALSKKFCQAAGWVQPNGCLRDMVARSYMLALHRAGYIKLPPRKGPTPKRQARKKKPPLVEVDRSPIEKKLKDISPAKFFQVRRSSKEALFASLIEEHHYLGYTQPVGEHLKYMVFSGSRPIACLAFSSAPRHIGPRDRYIGWDKATRRKNIHLICYNLRFLILPWVRIPNLASYLLARAAKILPSGWKKLYCHPVYYIETFVDSQKFAGTCYKAAGWQYLGDTTGRGKNDNTGKPNRSIKAIYGYPLVKDFRKVLLGGAD